MTDYEAEPRFAKQDDTEDKQASKSPQAENELFKNRTLLLFGQVDDKVSERLATRLLALAYRSDDPITLYISSPGGHVESGDTIFDLIQMIKPRVRTVGTGWVGSIAAHIYLAAEKENRFCLPNTRFLIHQPASGFGGTASDVAIHAKEIMKTRERINKIIAERSGQALAKVVEDTERDYWMSAEESVEYGLVGQIITDFGALDG